MKSPLQQKVAGLPTRPGVYRHKDADGKILYVGKAKNLRARVSSYFQEQRHRDGRLRILVRKIADVDVFVTDTEAEALILENNLIKEFRPRYNINLKDDKTYPYICIKKERFPRVFPTRRMRKDGSTYFGPYADVRSMHLMLGTIRSIFKLRTCSLNLAPEPIEAGKYQVCLQYHIKKCDAPCIGLQNEADYDNTIRQVQQLLHGKTGALIGLLTDEMERLSSVLAFEQAAELRNRIQALQKYSARQKVVSLEQVDRDLFAIAVDRDEGIGSATVFQVREGKIVGKRQQYLNRIADDPDPVIMQAVVERYYAEATFFPDEILLDTPMSDPEPVAELCRLERGRKVVIHTPERGDKAALIRMVRANAELVLEEHRLQRNRQGDSRIPHAVRTLQEDLKLPVVPRRIECFDVSHLGGTGIVASCIVFEDGRPRRSDYRSFKVRTVEDGHSDDFQSMREVVARRYRKMDELGGPPDLVVIDGGKGQLSSAVHALREIGVYGQFPIIGLAKRLEEVYFPGDGDSVHIPRASTSLQLLQRVRNEAHRFAVTLQRKQRKRKNLRTELTEIPGVGEKTARRLIETFGSVARIRETDEASLAEAVGPRLADRITAYFSQPSAPAE